jgi:hypothetical protein
MAFDDLYDAPVANNADDYTLQAANSGSGGMVDAAEDFISKTPAFAAAVVGAGAADIYNSGGAVIKFLGGDGWHEDTHDVINAMDVAGTGAADYYDQHKGLVDGSALLATSLIPGTLGIKALRAAQTGLAGTRILGSIGFDTISPAALDAARAAAADKATQVASVWDSMTGELGKALAIGVGSNVLDAAAFGSAAMVATNASPLYDGMTPMDMLKNDLWDSLTFGAAGGAFSAAKTFFVVKQAANTADLARLTAANIDTADGAALPVRIAATIGSLAKNMADSGGQVSPDIIKSVQSTVNSLGQSMVPDSDKALKVSWGNYAAKFATPTGSVGRPMDVEAANMFAKMQEDGAVRRIVYDPTNPKSLTAKMTGQSMLVDTSNGSMFNRFAQAPSHLSDMYPNGTDFALGKDVKGNPAIKVRISAPGVPDESIPVTGNIHSAKEMQASYLYASKLQTMPKEVELSMDNIPLAERAIEEAKYNEANRIENKFSLVGPSGDDLDATDAADALRAIKMAAVRDLAKDGFVTPEDIEDRLNLPSGFTTNPDNFGIQARSLMGRNTGLPDMATFLQTPRVVEAKYNLGTKITAAGKPKPVAFNRRNVTPANAFKSALDSSSSAGSQRLVTSPVAGANTAVYEQQAHAYIQNVLQANSTARTLAATEILPNLQLEMDEKSLTDAIRTDATRAGLSAQRFLGSANNNFGTTGAFLQKLGSFTKRASDNAKQLAQAAIGSASHALNTDKELGKQWILLQTKLRTTPANYVLDPEGTPQLVRQDIAINKIRAANARAAQAAGQEVKFTAVPAMDGDEAIPVSQDMLDNVLIPHTTLNNQRLLNRIKMDNQFIPGSSMNVALREGLSPVYHIPLNTNNYPHFLFVRDASRLVGNGSGVGMIFAKDAASLAAKRSELEQSHPGRFEFISKGRTKAFYQAQGEYQYDRGMNENFVDSSLRRSGKLGDMQPALSDRAVTEAANDLTAFHQRMAVREVRDAVELKYKDAIGQLDYLGQQMDEVAKSKMTNEKVAAYDASEVRNPYRDAINMMMDRGSANEFPLWTSINGWVERLGDGAFEGARSAWESIKASNLSEDELTAQVTKANQMAKDVGLEPLYTNTSMAQWKDQMATRPALRKFVSKAQAALNGLMLGFDPMQAINNGLGQVMFASEFRSLINNIEQDSAGAGMLRGLTKVQVPETPYSINSMVKLHAQATRRYLAGGEVWDDATKDWKTVSRDELRNEYMQHGLLTSISQQYHQMVDDLTLTARTMGDAELSRRWDSILDAGRKFTGNNLAEEYTRFVAADAARQLTDVAMATGKITDKGVASTYWNTAVNRVHGVNIASQRAVVFQGVIGHAIGMFMTYQHNLMQQLFRYTAEGDTAAMTALAASQFGLYGIQGLPAFNAISTHLIGTAYGNTNHSDAYSWIAKNANYNMGYDGGNLAEWILYGAGSNALGLINPDLKTNIYSRGDINPRELTLFPTSYKDTVLYSATLGVIKDFMSTVQNMSQGTPVTAALLQGLEHNNINRPLAGLGTVLLGQTTSNGGEMLGQPVKGANTTGFWDKFNLANFVRIAGSKPLDDASAADAMYRVAAYQAEDTSAKKDLAESLRLSYTGGRTPTPDEMQNFMQQYAKIGGNIAGFRSFAVNAYKTANNDKVTALAMKMRNPMSQYVASVLGDGNDQAWMQAGGGSF